MSTDTLRVLMLSQSYPPALGGEEQMVRRLSRALAARGHEVAVATLATDGRPVREDDAGVRVYRIGSTVRRVPWLSGDPTRVHAPPVPDPGIMAGLRRIIARERPQVVHAHNWMAGSFLPLKRWSGARFVLSLHDYSLTCPTKRLQFRGQLDRVCPGPTPARCLASAGDEYGRAKGAAIVAGQRLMQRAHLAAVDLFLPVSRAAALGNGLPPDGDRIEVLPNFVEPSLPDASAHRDLLARLPDGPFVLFVGAFAAHKGVDTLLEAQRRRSGGPPLVLIGYRSGEDLVGTDALPPGTHLHLDWPPEAVRAAWQRCTIGVVPSRWNEPLGLVALEAMLAERPVVASRLGGLPEVVRDGRTGVLVPPGDPAALHDAIEALLADPERCARLGREGRREALRRGPERALNRLEELYRGLLQGGAPAPTRRRPTVPAAERNGAAQGPAPTWVTDLEIDAPWPDVVRTGPADRGYDRAEALVRLHGVPLGRLVYPLPIDEPALARRVEERFGAEIAAHRARDGRGPGADRDGCAWWPVPRDDLPEVAVVVATRGRPESLERCLRSLSALDPPAAEVVVVDDEPGGSPEVRAACASDERVRYLRSDGRGVSAARNLGMQAARTDLVACTDDDVEVDRHWVRALAQRLVLWPEVAVVTGLTVPAELDTPAQQWFEEWGGLDQGYRLRRIVLTAPDGRPLIGELWANIGKLGAANNLALRRDVIDRVGGFDERLGPGRPTAASEDLELLLRLLLAGHELAYDPAAVVRHHHRRDVDALQRQLVGYGRGMGALLTHVALSDGRLAVDLARRVPTGLRLLLGRRSAKNVGRSSSFPSALKQAELRGYLAGPFAYVRASRGSSGGT